MNAPMTRRADLPADLLAQLTQLLGDARVKTDHDSRMNWGKDWTKHFEPNPSVVVFPKTTEEV